MITESTIYWLTRWDSIKDACIIIGSITTILATILSIVGCGIATEDKDRKGFYLLFSWIVPLIFLPGIVFIPTTKEMAAIKVIPVIANNEKAQEISGKLLDLTDEWIEEFRPNKNKEKQL